MDVWQISLLKFVDDRNPVLQRQISTFTTAHLAVQHAQLHRATFVLTAELLQVRWSLDHHLAVENDSGWLAIVNKDG